MKISLILVMLNILMSYVHSPVNMQCKHVFSITLENSVVTDQMASSDLAPRLLIFFSCSTQLSTKFQLLIKN